MFSLRRCRTRSICPSHPESSLGFSRSVTWFPCWRSLDLTPTTPATTDQSQTSWRSLRYSRSWSSLDCGHICTVHPISVLINRHIDRVIPRRPQHSRSRMTSTLTWKPSRAVCCCLLTSRRLSICWTSTHSCQDCTRISVSRASRQHGFVPTWPIVNAMLQSATLVRTSGSATKACHRGACWDRLMFSSYVSPIARIFDYFNISYHQYADDTQLYTAVRSAEDTSRLLRCVEEGTRWFLINELLLNAGKTEAIAFGTRQQLAKRATDTDLKIGDASVAIVESVKPLGVILDSTLSMDKQVNALVKACNFHIRALRHVRSCLTPGAARTISIGLVTSRLDYCNSLLYGTSESNLDKLQRVQNDLARVVLRAPWGCHAAPLLRDLHWLPIRFRIRYKVALMTYKARYSKEPGYLHSILHDYIPTRALRSSDPHLLEKPKLSTAKASRAFRNLAPVVWNSLSCEHSLCNITREF